MLKERRSNNAQDRPGNTNVTQTEKRSTLVSGPNGARGTAATPTRATDDTGARQLEPRQN